MASGRIANRLRTMRILWAAMLVAHVLFLLMIVSHVARSPGEVMPPHLPEMLGALSLGLALAAIVVPPRMFDVALRGMEVATTTEVGEAVGSFRESATVTKVVADPEKAVIDSFRRFQRPLMVGLAFAEAISLFGLLVGYYDQPARAYAPFFAVGIAIAASKFPRPSTFTRAIERVKGARCDLKL